MSDKNLDDAGRWRSKTVAFRVSPEKADLINAQVVMSGLTKQDYITKRLLARDVVVVPSSRVQRALQREAVRIYRELRRIRDAGDIGPELQARIDIFARTSEALGAEDPGRSDAEEEDAAIAHEPRRRERGRLRLTGWMEGPEAGHTDQSTTSSRAESDYTLPEGRMPCSALAAISPTPSLPSAS